MEAPNMLRSSVAATSRAFSQRLYFPLLDRVKGSHFASRLAEAQRNERQSPAWLRDLTARKLRATITNAAAEVPYYRSLLRSHGVDPTSIRDVGDLRRIPILTKRDLFENKRDLLGSRVEGRLFRGTTSGSTGIAMEFHQDSVQYGWCDASQWRGRGWWGVERGDPMIVLWSRPAANTRVSSWSAWAKNRLRNAVQFDTFQQLDAGVVDAIWRAVEVHRPRCIYGYGSSLGKLAQELDRRGVRGVPEGSLRLFEYTADHMYAEERAAAERVFGVPVATAYGSSECGGVAQQCRSGRLHISVDHVVVEFLREDGAGADPGERSRIVITQLNNRAMPLVRFEVGDLGSYDGDACPCGHPFPTMRLDVGKTVDLITTSSKRDVSAHLLDYVNLHLMKLGVRGVRQFQVEQRSVDGFVLTIVKDAIFEPRAVELFVAKMREYLGDTIEVDVRFTDDIPLEPSGKRRYFKKSLSQAAERA